MRLWPRVEYTEYTEYTDYTGIAVSPGSRVRVCSYKHGTPSTAEYSTVCIELCRSLGTTIRVPSLLHQDHAILPCEKHKRLYFTRLGNYTWNTLLLCFGCFCCFHLDSRSRRPLLLLLLLLLIPHSPHPKAYCNTFCPLDNSTKAIQQHVVLHRTRLVAVLPRYVTLRASYAPRSPPAVNTIYWPVSSPSHLYPWVTGGTNLLAWTSGGGTGIQSFDIQLHNGNRSIMTGFIPIALRVPMERLPTGRKNYGGEMEVQLDSNIPTG